MIKYCCYDLETGGLNPSTNAIVSVAAVFMSEDLTPVGHYYTLVRDTSDKTISDEALQVNGLTRDAIAKGESILNVLNILKVSMLGLTIVNHNSPFDCAFLNERGFNITKSIDTLLLSRKAWPGQKNNLTFACERAGVRLDNAHNSLYDARATAQLLKYFAGIPGLLALQETEIQFKR